MISRRRFLQSIAAGSLITAAWPGLCLSHAGVGQKRFVLVILRGGLDGLAAVAAYGDRDYEGARKGLALEPPGSADGVLDLDGFFGLHPKLEGLHEHYRRGELAVVHAVATPYRKRSHFDAQNVLELGLAGPHQSRQGWLNRTLARLDTEMRSHHDTYAMAIGQSLPLVLRGPESVASWAPTHLPRPDEELMARLLGLYADDDFLGPRLEAALDADEIAGVSTLGTSRRRRRDQFILLAEAAGRMLASESGPRIAVIEAGGWDTHANQGVERGRLAQRLQRLDDGLGKLTASLGAAWGHTVILVVTEFGRTVTMNGTRGSDHGTASVALLLGGAVQGGRVLGDWPGLDARSLYEERDLAPATDMRSLYKSVLRDHLGIQSRDLETRVFPGSGAARPMSDLISA